MTKATKTSQRKTSKKPTAATQTVDNGLYMTIRGTVEIIEIDPELLTDSKYQPRLDYDETSILELAHNIAETGLLQMPLVHRGVGEFREIICGHRRARACRLLGWRVMPVRLITSVLTPKEIRAIQLSENICREDLDPIEIAKAYDGLLEATGSIRGICDATGHKATTIQRQLKLLKLIPEFQNDLAEKKMTLGAAYALAELSTEDQGEVWYALTRDTNTNTGWEDFTAPGPRITEAVVADIIHDRDMELDRAEFDIGDSQLYGGACSGCPKRSSVQPDLFGTSKHDICLDRSCWEAKTEAHNKQLLEQYGQTEPRKPDARFYSQWADERFQGDRLSRLEAASGIRIERAVFQLHSHIGVYYSKASANQAQRIIDKRQAVSAADGPANTDGQPAKPKANTAAPHRPSSPVSQSELDAIQRRLAAPPSLQSDLAAAAREDSEAGRAAGMERYAWLCDQVRKPWLDLLDLDLLRLAVMALWPQRPISGGTDLGELLSELALHREASPRDRGQLAEVLVASITCDGRESPNEELESEILEEMITRLRLSRGSEQ